MQVYIAEGTQQTGPFDLDTIKSGLQAGKFQPAQLAWYEGAAGWEPLNKLPGLETFFTPSPPPTPPAPPPAPSMYPPAPSPYPAAPPPPANAYAPIAPPPAPYGAPPPYNAPSTPPPPAAPTSIWKKIGGFFAGLLAIILFILKVLFFGSHSYHRSYSSSSSSYTPTPHYTPAFSSPTPSPGFSSSSNNTGFFSSSSSSTTQSKHYVNNRADFTSGDRATHFVPFSFDYPGTWRLASGTHTKDQRNYVELNHPMQVRGSSEDVEQVTIGTFYNNTGSSVAAIPPALVDKLIAQTEQEVRSQFITYRRVSQGPVRVNGYNGYEYRGEGTMDDDGQTMQLYVRGMVLAPPTGQNGVLILMVSSSYVTEMHGANDVGVKGGTGTFLNSFRFQ